VILQTPFIQHSSPRLFRAAEFSLYNTFLIYHGASHSKRQQSPNNILASVHPTQRKRKARAAVLPLSFDVIYLH